MSKLDAALVKQAVLKAIDHLAESAEPEPNHLAPASPSHELKLLHERTLLADILGDDILGARPTDKSFPLRLLFGAIGEKTTHDGGEAAFTFMSGLNFFFRGEDMESEAQVRIALEVSRALYAVKDIGMAQDEFARATALLAQVMSGQLERVKLEAIDAIKMFDSQLHERAPGSDTSSSRIVRPATFLCRVAGNNAVKAKAQVIT